MTYSALALVKKREVISKAEQVKGVPKQHLKFQRKSEAVKVKLTELENQAQRT